MNTTLDTTLNALILDDDAWMLKILEARLKNACPNINVVKREVADLTGDFDVYLIDNDFSGNVIDVCPVGALTDRTFRFKSRVWFLNPMDAHRDCPTCCGKAGPKPAPERPRPRSRS